MGKSILEMLAENERLRVQQKNLKMTDDVQKSPYKEYGNSFGRFAGQIYSNDTNKESRSVEEVGDEALLDLKDLNVFPQDRYDRVSTDNPDASVIDMPEIEDISEGIYLNNLKYNKFIRQDYIPYTFQDANGVQNQIEDYGSYIEEIKLRLERQGSNLVDIFIGNFNEDDSPIGVIGAQALNNALNTQFAANLDRETFGRINTQAFSVFQTGNLIRKDYDITVRRQPIARALEFATELQGFEFPFSYLPQDVFGIERIRIEDNGIPTYIGSSLTTKERIARLLQYTGKGQQTHLINLLKLNIYNPEILGKFETLDANQYLPDFESSVGNPNALDFVVTFSKSIDDGRGSYEPYGVVSIHKRTNVGQLISDTFAWKWIDDVPNEQAIGWVDTNGSNRFTPKSLLHRTQEIINGFSNGGFSAFMDMADKQYVEVKNGETFIISRGDATTASGDYVDDDGTFISKGEYFRVWTKNRGYNKLSRTLRHRGLDNGDTRSVLNDNGLVNIAPTIRKANAGNGLQSDEVIKRYMFSLENLAWNDNMADLPLCEQGVGDPVTGTRGRIMWFPPYNLNISESSNANLESTQFIGRSEPIYTWNSSERTATLTFTIIVDHPDVVNRLVGQKSEFWERYFKGEKLIENEARVLQTLNKKLSQTEIQEIQKRRNYVQPIEKNNDKPNITPRKKEDIEKKKVQEEVDENALGDISLSVYFPNNETNLPAVPVQFSLEDESNDFDVVNNLTLNDLKNNNYGYEDGGETSNLDFITQDGYTINTTNGIRYISEGEDIAVNGIYTYNRGVLIDDRYLCNDLDIAPRGYKDRNNNGLNSRFYFQWKNILLSKLKNAKRAKINIIGNASAALPPSTTDNTSLSKGRADAVKAWFDSNVLTLLGNLGIDVEIEVNSRFVGDLEDTQKRELADEGEDVGFCEDCDEADNINCKKSRRVDIFINVLEEGEDEPEQPNEVDEDTTIEEDETNEDLNPDDDEVTTDPDNPQDIPEIDPNILKKLIYTECDYFQYLEINDPIAYQTISERIKYFMPAYHSITPQGFNSRLTFLQQCLRQGDSIGRDGVENWKNLAFGRPPVCILRIGDFYHTRVMIESMNIEYSEGMTWDLNPEGIGVQPMYADITLNLKILGGSSMTAPINRLQNALSFNYYANTEMYDGRADSVVFVDKSEEGGEGDIDTLGELKNGRIVDGIRLSSLTNYSETEQKRRLAQLRQQSRITLQNSTTAQASTEQISSFGEVESLLELKKSLGVPLTESEKVTQKSIEFTEGAFQSDGISEEARGEVVNSLRVQLQNEDSLLNRSAEELLEQGVDTDRSTYYSIVDQFLSATVTEPEEIIPEYSIQVADEYLEGFKFINE